MKYLSSVLILVVLVHLQCGGSCLIEAFGGPVHETPANNEPPCHRHSDVPANDPEPSHESNSPCAQGQFIESRTVDCGKVVLEIVGILPPTVPITQASELSHRLVTPGSPALALPASVPISILRI